MKDSKILWTLALALAWGSAHAKEPSKSSAPVLEEARLAAGCFWGVEEYFRKIPGVVETEVGYAGGTKKNPGYEAVSAGSTGHAESLRLKFDPAKITFEQLLLLFFKMHDPTTPNAQGNDRGTQYRSAIFPQSPTQKIVAEKVIAKVEKSMAWKKKLSTTIETDPVFYRAEDYHQKYLVKHPDGYDNHFVRDLKFD